MNLYIICRSDPGPEDVRRMLVRAADTENARSMASRKAASGDADTWLHIRKSTITLIGSSDSNEPAVLLVEPGTVIR